MEKEIEERLTAVEMKLAYMEDFVSQIQGVAVEQFKTIDKLQKEIKMMSEKIREMSIAVEGDIPNRKHRTIKNLRKQNWDCRFLVYIF